MTYWANVLGTSALSGNRYWNSCLSSVFEIAAALIAWMMMEVVDGRICYVLSALAAAVAIGASPILATSRFSEL